MIVGLLEVHLVFVLMPVRRTVALPQAFVLVFQLLDAVIVADRYLLSLVFKLQKILLGLMVIFVAEPSIDEFKDFSVLRLPHLLYFCDLLGELLNLAKC